MLKRKRIVKVFLKAASNTTIIIKTQMYFGQIALTKQIADITKIRFVVFGKTSSKLLSITRSGKR